MIGALNKEIVKQLQQKVADLEGSVHSVDVNKFLYTKEYNEVGIRKVVELILENLGLELTFEMDEHERKVPILKKK